MTEPTAPRGPGWWRPLARADRRALWFLVLLPTVLFSVPALLGHPAIAQDNYIQNYPLRILSARQLWGGHLPLFNALANSGTPLLGGMNAGSFYPLSLLFVVVPAMVAWVMNLIAVYVTAGVGMYALCRWLSLSSRAALLASAAFTYAGAMMGQMVHLQVVQGFALLPWLVLAEMVAARALLRIGAQAPWRRQVRTALPAVVGFSVIWGLTFLTGEPRSIAELELVSLVVVAMELLVHSGPSASSWRGRLWLVGANVVGFAWGAAIALVQLLPGWAFIAQSERSNEGYFFFGSGSLSVKWTWLLFDQDLLGGNGTPGTPHYFAGYNLAEVTGYAGLVALTAVVAFFVQLTWRGWRDDSRPFGVFAVLVVVGLWASWGNFTPAGHLFHALPLFGKTRLQSRNLVVVDLGAAVLMGWWLDRLFVGKLREASLTGWRRIVTALPAATALGLVGSALVVPLKVQSMLAIASYRAVNATRETVPLVAHLTIALAVLALVALALRSPRSRRWLVGVVVADLVLFNLYCDVGFATGSTSTWPTRAASVAVLGTEGRYAIVDPGQNNFATFEQLGVPNLNVLTGLSSIQGYGSLVSLRYGAVTGTHPMVSLNACNLVHGRFAQLRLATLVLSPSALSYPAGTPNRYPACSPPTSSILGTTRFFGSTLAVTSLSLDLASPRSATGTLSIRLLDGAGHALGPTRLVSLARSVTVRFPGSPVAAGFTVSSPGPVTVLHASVTPLGAGPLRLDNAFEQAMDSSAWRLVSSTDQYSVFRASHVRPAQWLEGSGRADRITTTRSASWGDEWVSVKASTTVTLVRSVAWLDGWRCEISDGSGHSRSLHVSRHGLIQSVEIPPGTWEAHFHYHAPYVELSLAVSAVSVSAFALVVAILTRPRWRAWRKGRVSA